MYTLPFTLWISASFAAEAAASGEDEPAGAEIVVEGERAEVVAPALTVITLDESFSAGSDVASAVDLAAGTTVRRLGGLGDFAAVSIRGSSFRQVQVYLDGVPLNPDGASVVNLSELPLGAFQRVEVYRGGAPASFAAAPIGGVVNLVSPEAAATTSVQSSLGSLGTSRVGGLGGGRSALFGRPVEALVFVDSFHTRGDFAYFSDNGTPYNLLDDRRALRDNNDKSQLSAHLRLRMLGPDWSLSVLDAPLLRDEGLPGHGDAPASLASLQTRRNLLSAELAWRGLRLRGWDQRRGELLDDRAGELGISTEWELSRTSSSGLLLHLPLPVGPRLVPALTLSARSDRFLVEDRLGGAPRAPARRSALVGVASTEAWVWSERLRLEAALHGSLLDNRHLGLSLGGEPVSAGVAPLLLTLDPRASAQLRPMDGLVLQLAGGRALRPPDFSELFGDRGVSTGNPDLVPERSWYADAGLRWALPGTSPLQGAVELGAFAVHSRDLIAWVQNSQRTQIPVNIGEARTLGLEAAAQADWRGLAGLQGSLTRTWSQTWSPDASVDGKQLPRVPAWELNLQGSALVHEGLRLGYTGSWTAGNFEDRTNWHSVPPRSLQGAFVRLAPWPDGAWPEAELSVLNLLDRRVEVVPRNPLDPSDPARVVQAMTDFSGYPLPGRTFLFSLRWSA